MATTFDNPLGLVRQLKGAPLSVLIACQIVRMVVSHRWICEQTGYSDYAVTRAVSYLTEHNLLAKVNGGWMIATAAQLPLMPDLLEGGEPAVDNRSSKNREKRDFPPKNVPTKTTGKDAGEIDACMALLKDAGIFGKRAREIAEAEHVTADYLKAHLVQIESETWDNPLGMLIWRVTECVPAPELQSNGHPMGCKCNKCTVDRYLGGKYAAYVNPDDEDGDQP